MADVLASGKAVARNSHAVALDGRAVVLLIARVGGKRHLALGDLVLLGHRAGVVTGASDGHGNGADVLEVGGVGAVALVGNGVVGASNQGVAVGVLDLGYPLVVLGIVLIVAGIVDRHALVGRVRVLGIGARHDGLLGHLKGAVDISNVVVADLGRGAVLGNKGVAAGALLDLGARELVVEGLATHKAGLLGRIRRSRNMLDQRLAVIDLEGIARGQGHRAGGNSQGALGLGVDTAKVAGHVIASGVEDLEGVDLSVALALIGLGALEGVARGEAAGDARDSGRGVLALKRGAVVNLARAGGDDIDRSGVRRHFKLADGLVSNGVVGRLGVVAPRNLVAVAALANHGLRALGHKGCGLVANKARDLAAGSQRRAVVLLLGRVGLDRKLGRLDLNGAVVVGDLEVLGHVDTLGVLDNQVVCGGSDALAVGVGSRGVRSGLGGVPSRQISHRDGRAVRQAVIGEGATSGGHHDLVLALGHGQRAELLRDLVVALLGGAGPVDLVPVGAVANGGLRTSHREGRGLVVDKTVDGAGGSQGLAVICPARRLGNNAQLRLIDLVRAVKATRVVALTGDGHGNGAVDVGEVGTVAVANLVIGALDQGLLAVLNNRDPLVLLAVIGHVTRVVDGDAAGFVRVGDDGLGGDRQRALVLGLDVVVALLSGTPGDGVAVLGRADVGLGAISHNCSGLAVNKTGEAIVRGRGGQRRAVVDLGRARRAYLQRSLGNLIGLGDGASIVALAGNGNGHGADVGGVRAIGNIVIGTRGQDLCAILNHRSKLLLLAVVNNVRRIRDGHAIGLDALGLNR